jgi:uncharacterized protein YkwD
VDLGRIRSTSIIAAAIALAHLLSPSIGSSEALAASQGPSFRNLIAPVGVCPEEPGPSNLPGARRAMLCMTNFARSKRGLRKYRKNGALSRSADRKAKDILWCNSFSHSACGRDFTHWIERTGYTNAPCWTVGENIAWGDGRFGTSRSIFAAWLRSPSHRSAIFSRRYADFGIGVDRGKLKGYDRAIVWVQHFGKRC